MKQATLRIKSSGCEVALKVRLAEGRLAQTRGLSFYRAFPADGLLFLFKKPGRPPFWMWGMRFGLDLLWISEDCVIGWEENLKPPRSLWHLLFPFFLDRYYPPRPVTAVLEVPAGFVKKYGFVAGQVMSVQTSPER